MQAPLWVSILGSLGVASLASTIISLLANARLQERNWVKDNQKQEWRELIGTLSFSVRRILRNLPALEYPGLEEMSAEQKNQLLDADMEARRIIEDRIFIFGRVQSENLLERWQLIAAERDVSRMLEYWNHLHSALVNAAHKDLGIKQ